eukprot:CAMPEP_0183725146 /NCGR_PEP_ID=MMETSP0737-20130205/19655_1 /TAXON_ID=385413 /ORGANISM="Thalassiosira miniscula, Strain CCMP1093" /LENGTH=40 /DNA_ID= /DNA_START= /DNA_END= /DNA_ORIENTATION=
MSINISVDMLEATEAIEFRPRRRTALTRTPPSESREGLRN